MKWKCKAVSLLQFRSSGITKQVCPEKDVRPAIARGVVTRETSNAIDIKFCDDRIYMVNSLQVHDMYFTWESPLR